MFSNYESEVEFVVLSILVLVENPPWDLWLPNWKKGVIERLLSA